MYSFRSVYYSITINFSTVPLKKSFRVPCDAGFSCRETRLRLPCTFRGCASKNNVARPD